MIDATTPLYMLPFRAAMMRPSLCRPACWLRRVTRAQRVLSRVAIAAYALDTARAIFSSRATPVSYAIILPLYATPQAFLR